MSTATPVQFDEMEAHRMMEQAKTLTVSTVSARQLATELLDALKAFRKQNEALKEETCRPLKTAWDVAKSPFDSFEKECKTHQEALQRKMSAYDAEQDRLARAEQAKIQAKIDADNAKKIAKAQEKGKDISEVVLKVAPVVQVAPKTVTTSAGTLSTRIERKVYRVKDAADDEDLTASDPRVSTILAVYPELFIMDWPKFRKIASTGMLDRCSQVASSIEYSYSQRKGR